MVDKIHKNEFMMSASSLMLTYARIIWQENQWDMPEVALCIIEG